MPEKLVWIKNKTPENKIANVYPVYRIPKSVAKELVDFNKNIHHVSKGAAKRTLKKINKIRR